MDEEGGGLRLPDIGGAVKRHTERIRKAAAGRRGGAGAGGTGSASGQDNAGGGGGGGGGGVAQRAATDPLKMFQTNKGEGAGAAAAMAGEPQSSSTLGTFLAGGKGSEVAGPPSPSSTVAPLAGSYYIRVAEQQSPATEGGNDNSHSWATVGVPASNRSTFSKPAGRGRGGKGGAKSRRGGGVGSGRDDIAQSTTGGGRNTKKKNDDDNNTLQLPPIMGKGRGGKPKGAQSHDEDDQDRQATEDVLQRQRKDTTTMQHYLDESSSLVERGGQIPKPGHQKHKGSQQDTAVAATGSLKKKNERKEMHIPMELERHSAQGPAASTATALATPGGGGGVVEGVVSSSPVARSADLAAAMAAVDAEYEQQERDRSASPPMTLTDQAATGLDSNKVPPASPPHLGARATTEVPAGSGGAEGVEGEAARRHSSSPLLPPSAQQQSHQFSPESTMDRPIPDPSCVPRIVTSLGANLEGTLDLRQQPDGSITGAGGGAGGVGQQRMLQMSPSATRDGSGGGAVDSGTSPLNKLLAGGTLTNDTMLLVLERHPKMAGEVAARQSRKGPVKCLYGHKLGRKLAHPLQEERPYFDVWPANNTAAKVANLSSTQLSLTGVQGQQSQHESVFVRPQLLNELEDTVRGRLQSLSASFPNFAERNTCNPPSDEVLSPRQWKSAMKRGKQSAEVQSKHARDLLNELLGPEYQQQQQQQPPGLGQPRDAGAEDEQHEHEGEVTRYSGGGVDLEANIGGGGGEETMGSSGAAGGRYSSPLLNMSGSTGSRSVTFDDTVLSSLAAAHEQTFGLEEKASEEDQFRAHRVRIFSDALAFFAEQFKSYRRLLLWIGQEFDEFLVYCHKNVLSEETQRRFRTFAYEAAKAQVARETQQLRDELALAKEKMREATNRYKDLKTFHSQASAIITEKDLIIKEKEIDLADAATGRAALLGQIETIEKELWNQRNLMEGPERRCQELTQLLTESEEKVKRGLETIDELAKDRQTLRLRVEKLEEGPKRGGGGATGSGATGGSPTQQTTSVTFQLQQGSDLFQYKKREMDILEHLGQYKAKYDRAQSIIKEMEHELTEAKFDRGGQIYTPRPNWEEVGEMLPQGSSTSVRVVHAAMEMNNLMEGKAQAAEEVQRLKDLIGALPRGLTDVSMGDLQPQPLDGAVSTNLAEVRDEDRVDTLVHEMQLPYFFKLGLGTAVPTYLKGTGFAMNLKLTRNAVAQYCRQIWHERDVNSRSSVPVEQFLSRFASRFAPEGVEPDVFAYNLHHTLHWYAFDSFIGFTKDYITGRLDELCFYNLQSQVKVLKDTLMKRGNASQSAEEGGAAGGGGDSPGGGGGGGGGEDGEENNPLLRNPANIKNDPNALTATATLGLTAVIGKTRIISALMETLSMKCESDVKDLILALGRDCPGKDVDLTTLFNFNDRAKCYSAFLEEWYSQQLAERNKLLRDLSVRLFRCKVDENHEVAPPDIANAFWEVDPDAPIWYMDTLIATLFGVKEEDLFPSVTMEGITRRHVGCRGQRVYQCEDTITIDLLTLLRRLRRYPLRLFTAPKSPSKLASDNAPPLSPPMGSLSPPAAAALGASGNPLGDGPRSPTSPKSAMSLSASSSSGLGA